MQRPTNILGAILIGVLVGCGGSTGPDATNTSTTPQPSGGTAASTVMVSNNTFSPDNLTTAPGTSITWKWDSCAGDGYGGSTCTEHSVTFSDGTTSPTQSSGTFTKTFAAAGTYTYKCAIHGTYMTGTVVVR